jgi:hypothetical protein
VLYVFLGKGAFSTMHYEEFKNLTAGIQSIATVIALGVGAYWTYGRFIRSREGATKIDLDIDLSFVHKQGSNWIVEGVALVKNPGNVRLEISDFTYQLNYALAADDFGRKTIENDEPKEGTFREESLHLGVKSSWVEGWDYTYLEPGERSRFTFIASLPPDSTVVLLHSELSDKNKDTEIVRKLFGVPTTGSKSIPEEAPKASQSPTKL